MDLSSLSTPQGQNLGLLPISGPPAMRRINGFGPGIAGGFKEPLLPNCYYKQFVFTALYFPIFFGHIYLVEGDRSGGWKFYARMPLTAFVRRFGLSAYVGMLVSVLFESAALLLALILALGFAYAVVYGVRALFRG